MGGKRQGREGERKGQSEHDAKIEEQKEKNKSWRAKGRSRLQHSHLLSLGPRSASFTAHHRRNAPVRLPFELLVGGGFTVVLKGRWQSKRKGEQSSWQGRRWIGGQGAIFSLFSSSSSRSRLLSSLNQTTPPLVRFSYPAWFSSRRRRQSRIFGRSRGAG